jgi:NTE family protein
VALVLSGGSAKGFAHVGVIEVLETLGVRVDVVTGTSMGSVIGGLYASGMSTDSIRNLIRRTDWDRALGDDLGREHRALDARRLDERSVLTLPLDGGGVRLPTGIASGSNMMRLAEHSTWSVSTVREFADLPRPFVAVATDIETGEAVVLQRGSLAEVMRASSGLPGVLEPLEIDGRLLVDGAVTRNLPAQDARALDADVVVCSDVAADPVRRDELLSLIDVLEQVLRFSVREETIRQRGLCDVLIRPDDEGLSTLSFESFEEWFERGRQASEEHHDALVEIAGRQAEAPVRPRPTGLPDSVRIATVSVRGVTREGSEDVVRAYLGLTPGDWVDADRLDERLRRLESTGLFGLTRYRLDDAPGGLRLTVTVEERPRDRAGLGIRYDDQRRAALLFTATLHNLLRYGSVTRVDLRVGEETQARVSYLRRYGVTGRFQGGLSLGWSEGELHPGDMAPTGIELTRLSTTSGLLFGQSTFLGVEVAGEWAVMRDPAYPDVLLGSVAALLDHESLDRVDFPRRGVDIRARWEFGVSDLAPGGDFSHLSSSAHVYLPLHARASVDAGFFAGSGQGGDLPIHRRFLAGGQHPSAIFSTTTQPLFGGVPSQALSGSAVQIGRAGLRVEVLHGVHIRGGVDVGGVMDEWSFPIQDPLVGWRLTLGVDTVVGPATLEWGWTEEYGDRLAISVGRSF